MPSTERPRENISSDIEGAPFSNTLLGPPERMMPFALNPFMKSIGEVQGCISQYTFASLTLRAMSCVYWEPKSRISILSEWMSGLFFSGAFGAVFRAGRLFFTGAFFDTTFFFVIFFQSWFRIFIYI